MGEKEDALDRSVRALARRDHSAASLRAKLDRAGISEAAQQEAVSALERAGYVDDARFALGRAEHLAAKGYGDEWIRGDLEAQGVDPDTAIGALAPEQARAEEEWRRLGGGVKAVKTLARRGFSEDSLEALLHRTQYEE